MFSFQYSSKRLPSSAKSLIVIILTAVLTLSSTEIVSELYINRLNKRSIENYEKSLSSILSFWNNRFDVVKRDVVQISSIDDAYILITTSKDALIQETSKRSLVDTIDYFSLSQQHDFHFFTYFPDQNQLFIESKNYLKDMDQRNVLKERIIKLTEEQPDKLYWGWSILNVNAMDYFVCMFSVQGAYVGAYIPTDDVMEDIQNNYSIPISVYLEDENGNMIYKSGKQIEDTIDIEQRISNLDYIFHICVQRQYFYSGRQFMLLSVASIIFVGIICLFISLRTYMRNILLPMDIFIRGMKEFGNGNVSIQLDMDSSGNSEELRSLYKVFNDMVKQISVLKIQVYEKTLEKERIESNYVLTRVQPHFYANILNLITFFAQIKDYQSIIQISNSTGKYFRYLLGDKGTFIRLSDEVSCIKSYIDIQKIRYKDFIEFEYVSDITESECMVIPMILQTFVSNSIKHNVTLVPVLRVVVHAYKDQGELHLMIEDNGVGFDPAVLEKIQQHIDISDGSGHHIGIQNTMDRIRMFYKDCGSVSIQSEPGNTVVTIVLPVISNQ